MSQPNGSELPAYQKGNQSVHYLRTTDGYTLIKDKDGFHKYALSAKNGNLVPSPIIANPEGKRTPKEINFLAFLDKELSFSKSTLAQKEANYLNKSAAGSNGTSGPQMVFPATGTRKSIMLLIDYPDQPFTFSTGAIDNMMNQSGYSVNGAAGSFREYYMDNSYGTLDIDTDILGWYTAANNRATYKDAATNLVREAVDAAEAAGTDFAPYDGDGDGAVDVIMVIHSGRGQEESGDTDDIWSHRWILDGEDNSVSYDGKYINDYIIQAEKFGPSNITNIGVVVHEFGHALGLPDLYDTNGATDGEGSGAGDWCVMAAGTWNNSGKTPAHMNAWCKDQLGWGNPTILSSTTSISGMNYWDNTGDYYKINMPGASEYLLISNRQKQGWDAYIPGEGLDIWHIDPSLTGEGNTVNSNTSHYGVQLEQADNLNNLNNNSGGGDTGDLFPGSSANTTFDCSSAPNSSTHLGANTDIKVHNIIESGTSMSFDFTFCIPTAMDCSNAIPISCNNTYMGSTMDSTNTISSYSCSADDLSGNEVIYILELDAETEITISLSDMTEDLDLYLLNSCTENSCLATADNSLIYTAPAGVYYLIVDGKDGANSDFTLTTSCYCNAQGNSVADEWIESITIANSTNNSGTNGGYGNFTNTVIPMNRNATYNLSLSPGHTGPTYGEYWKIWIDYNKNGSFDDLGEEAFDAGSPSSSTVTGTFTIPNNALFGNTRMRVAMRYNTAPSNCGAFDFGEVEDYTVDIQGFPAPDEIIAHSSDNTYTANASGMDESGWMHYVYDDGMTRHLLLSILPDPAETQLDIDASGVTVTTGAMMTTSLSATESSTDYITNPDGWHVMNRYWDVIPTAQPLLPVTVRTYFTTAEFSGVQSLANSNGASANAMTDLVFYKVSGASPSDHNNITEANITIYNNGDPTAGDFWELGAHESDHYAEFKVSSFSGGGGGIGGGTAGGPLPVELVSFFGKREGGVVQLNWESAAEINSKYYEIQRSPNRTEFTTLGKMAAHNLISGSFYTYADLSPEKGDNYYRLKMVDNDGVFEYSNVITIHGTLGEPPTIVPNPFDKFIQVRGGDLDSWELIDIYGRIVLSGNEREIETSDLEAGTYYLNISRAEGRDFVERLVKY